MLIRPVQFFDNLPVQIALTCARQSGSEDLLTMLLSSMISSLAWGCRKVAAGEAVEIETVEIYGWS